MKPPAARMGLAALIGCLVASAPARADFVDWSYNWTPSATAIFADGSSTSKITFTNEPAGTANGTSYISATNLKTVSDATAQSPATFTNVPYSLTLTITDTGTGKSDSFVFKGLLNGTLSAKSALITNQIQNATLQSKVIGDHLYTVSLNAFAPPGPPTATNSGSISALVGVSTPEAPEPSTLALAGLGLSLAGAGCWWRARRKAALAVCQAC